MTETDKLELPDIGGYGSSVILNEAMFKIDIAHHCYITSKVLTTPPASPSNGDTYIPAATATGAWAGHEGEIASWYEEGNKWIFIVPWIGFTFMDSSDLTKMFVFTVIAASPTFKSWAIA